MVLDIQYIQLDVDGSQSGIKIFGFRTGRKYPTFTDTNSTHMIWYYFVSCLESMLSHWSYVLFMYGLPTLPADWRCVSWAWIPTLPQNKPITAGSESPFTAGFCLDRGQVTVMVLVYHCPILEPTLIIIQSINVGLSIESTMIILLPVISIPHPTVIL